MADKAGKLLALAKDLDLVLGFIFGFESLGVGRCSISEISAAEFTTNMLVQSS
jgi:hypothetical protein